MDLDYSTYYSDQPRLPVEIIARIIEESKDDRETLRQFALVSSACLKYARQNIFHTVTLDSEARVSTLHNVISIAPEIVRSIRTVHFSAYKHYMARHKTPPPDLQRWIPQAVATLAQALTNVTAVHFDYIQWDTLVWSPDAFAASLRLISAASEVKFRACNFGQFSQFERILTGLPAMKRLILNSVQWKRFDSLPERYTLSMNTLQVVFPQVPNTLRPWLSKINALTTLRGLEFNELQVHHEDDLLEAGRFLGFMGASLRNLTIGCAFSIEGYAKFQGVFSPCRTRRPMTDCFRRHRTMASPEGEHWLGSSPHPSLRPSAGLHELGFEPAPRHRH